MDELTERGNRVRREVLGAERADRPPTAFGARFRQYAVRTAWGEVWSRDNLDRRTRSAITLAVLTALRATDELEMHLIAACIQSVHTLRVGPSDIPSRNAVD